MSRPGPSGRVRRGVGRGCGQAVHQPAEIFAVVPAEGGHGGRGRRGEAGPEPSGVRLCSSKSSVIKSSTPCAARRCSSIVRSGGRAASGIRQHTVPCVSPDVTSDSRLGEGRAIGTRPCGRAPRPARTRHGRPASCAGSAREVGAQLVARVLQLRFLHDVVAVKDGSGAVPG